MRRLATLALLTACSDHKLVPEKETLEGGSPTADPLIDISPALHSFGELAEGDSSTVVLTVANLGAGELTIDAMEHESSRGMMQMDTSLPGPLPWVLAPGASTELLVSYAPDAAGEDTSNLVFWSDDPTNPEALAVQTGSLAVPFEGFSTGWYVLDDGVAHETTSSSAHVVDHHGDSDLYFYEPSGAHGLLDSTNPEADFALMRQYVLDRAGSPTVVSGPFEYDGDSDLATFEYATFTYFMCDFHLPADDDPARYQISSGAVDDGIQVMVNGQILGRLSLGETGSFPLTHARAGEVNTLIIILVDDSKVDKYIRDLAFYRDGVMVEG